MSHRVVITGLGCLMPNGNHPEEFCRNLLAGRSGAAPITAFEASGMPTRIAGEVKWAGPRVAGANRMMGYAHEAARQAFEWALRCGSEPRGEGRLFLGVGLETFDLEQLAEMRRPGFELPAGLSDRLRYLHMPADLGAHLISNERGFTQPPLVTISTCAAGLDAVGVAARAITSGSLRWAMAGATDTGINRMVMSAFSKLQALSTDNDPPEGAAKPFSSNRNGFLMGEGSGVMILERLEDAEARGAEVLAEVCGYGNSLDAFGVAEPHPEGRGAVQAMQRALADGGLSTDEVDVVNAHATGTRLNDPIETRAVKQVFGDRAYRMPVCATKSMIGHLLCAAGAAEAIASVLCMREDQVHPTLNLHDPDPECDLDYVPLVARDHPTRVVMCNSFGLGGMNASMLLRKL